MLPLSSVDFTKGGAARGRVRACGNLKENKLLPPDRL